MRTAAIGSKVFSSARFVPRGPGWGRVRHYLPLALCLLTALVLRAWLVVRTRGFIDGDEALVGIQAQRILHGALPTYFYGQPYMGSLEAYLIALIFAIVGSSTWAMRCEPILLGLVLVWLTWRLAVALASEARLPEAARRWFIVVSTFCAAIPPLYDGIIEMRTWGGHIETYVLILWLLLSTLRLLQRWRAGATAREMAWRWAGIGLLVGLGLWVYPLIIVAIITVALWIAWTVGRALWHAGMASSDPDSTLPTRATFWRNCVLAVAALPTFLIGCAPALVWGASNHWANVLYLLSPNNQDSQNVVLHRLYPDRLALLRGTLTLYGHCVVPRVIGGALPNVSPTYALVQASVGMLVMLAALFLTVWAGFRPTLLLRQLQGLISLPLLFAAVSACVFCVSGISAAALLFPCTRDEVGRYAAPLALVLPFFFAAVITAAYLYFNERSTQKNQVSAAAPEGSSETAGQKIPMAVRGVLLALIVVYLVAQAASYVRANPTYTFQSFACQVAPIDDAPIISYMQKEHMRYAWATVWIGNAIVFRTDSRIIVADPRIVTAHADNRIPANTAAVQRADRPAVLAFALHSDAHPALLSSLDAQGVSYTVARFPAAQGMDVLVVQPDRTLAPATANALGAWFYNC